MKCNNCGTDNDADSKFCKECGEKLVGTSPATNLDADDHIRVGELVYQAYRCKEEGRLQEAILACQGALALNDASAAAHALLASLFEEKGDIASSIYEYERAIALNPASIAERQKLEQLRDGQVYSPSQRRIPSGWLERLRPYTPLAAALTGFGIVLVLSLLLMGNSSSGGARNERVGTNPPQSGIPQEVAPVQPYGQSQVPQGQHDQQGQYQGHAQEQDEPAVPSRAGMEGAERPGVPPVPISGRESAENRRPAPPAGDERPILPVNTSPASSEAPVIRPVIEPANPSPIIVRSSELAPKTNPANENPEARAQRLQRAGRYEEAITAYREASAKSGNSGRIYQQMALCYQRLGQREMAADSYDRAIRLYKEQQSAGHDSVEIQRNIRSCERGLDVLRSAE